MSQSQSVELVKVIKSAHRRHAEPARLRKRLLRAGVPKGTTSKCVTILVCLNRGTFSPDDFKSLSGGYALAQNIHAVTVAATGVINGDSPAPIIRPVLTLGFQKP